MLVSLLITISYQKSHQKCGHRCNECEIDGDGNIKCLVCPQGYQRSNYQCFPCELEGCGACNKNSAMCSRCIFGWYNATTPGYSPEIQYVFKCKKCPDGCQICNKDDTCEICAPGYRMDSEFHCLEDDHETIFWIMLLVFCFFGAIVFLMMRMRIFFKKKEPVENLETVEDLASPVDIDAGPKRSSKPKLTIVTAGDRRKGRKMTINGMKLNRALKVRNNKHSLGTAGTMQTLTEL
jgi:hypothetical protein